MVLNLEWLRTFKAIYETGTLSAAAQELFISQPGVSLHLNSLEAYTGHKLFDRSPRKMVPTEQGKVLYNFVLDPLRKLEAVEQHFHKSSKSERPTISVGMCFETFQYTLEEHIASLPFNLIIKFGEYPQMQQDLDNGLLDLIVTPQQGQQQNLQYKPFSKERIVLIAGGQTDTEPLIDLFAQPNKSEAANWLKQQIWYSTAADMEHLKNFWLKNFDQHPDFRPNYIVPNICSIIRCLSDREGFSIVPHFLCVEAIETGQIQLVWEGNTPLENTLYFGTRKKTIYQKEIEQLQELFISKWKAPEAVLV
ncbi:LysR family transcriptional regulator [Dyadobacter jiangsuensis]|uniref:DNA-binding transcriptional LysR family regulator n=1 Tax=Dyadobacter jiangsuensis TaxID=1591085 RepID=A0A2P8GJS3_9BACT|nr:LysR family transcriptional regulator [Dyadobacter jiangsuensis]PSL34211.1 DNA-binding transcriptional LysR family regulator [Dyadobacter jiangsuensis]